MARSRAGRPERGVPRSSTPAAPDLAGKWKAYQMPQWTAGTAVNGNYGGSTIAVTAASAHPAEAETFNRWLNTDPGPTLALANGAAGLFPVTLATLADPAWSDFTSDFFGGQKLHQVTGEAAQAVDVYVPVAAVHGFRVPDLCFDIEGSDDIVSKNRMWSALLYALLDLT